MVLCCDPAAIALTIAVAGRDIEARPTSDAAGTVLGFKKLLIDNEGTFEGVGAPPEVVRQLYERTVGILGMLCHRSFLLVFMKERQFVVRIFGVIYFFGSCAAGEHKNQ